MSDNTSEEEQQQQMQEIFICADVWLEVFVFFSPLELGHLIALISKRFDVLVDEHFKLRKWSLGSLRILRAIDGNYAEIVIKSSGELLPIPQGPLPNKVIGLEELEISCIDQTVLDFLQRIRRLFDSAETTVCLTTSDDQNCCWEFPRQNWSFVNGNSCDLFMSMGLRHQAPAILCCNCANFRSIVSVEHFPADDNADASSDECVAKWLLSSCEDGYWCVVQVSEERQNGAIGRMRKLAAYGPQHGNERLCSDRNIGDGMGDEEAGPSEPKK